MQGTINVYTYLCEAQEPLSPVGLKIDFIPPRGLVYKNIHMNSIVKDNEVKEVRGLTQNRTIFTIRNILRNDNYNFC